MKSKAEVELTKCQAADAIKLLLLLLLLSPAFKQIVVAVLRLQLQLQLTCGSPRQLAAFKTSQFFFLLPLKFAIPLSRSSSFLLPPCFSPSFCCGFFFLIAFIKLRPVFNLRSLRSPSVIKFCAKHLPFFCVCLFFLLLSSSSSPSPSASSCGCCRSFKWFVSILVARVLLYIYVFHGTPFHEPVNAANICRLHYDAKQEEGEGRVKGDSGDVWRLAEPCVAWPFVSPLLSIAKLLCKLAQNSIPQIPVSPPQHIPSSSRLGAKKGQEYLLFSLHVPYFKLYLK